MADDFLSQDEVDALLSGVGGADDNAGSGEVEAGPHTHNLATQERIVRGRMPTLEIIHERFARNLRVGLSNFMRRSAEVSAGAVKVQKYGEFVRNLVVPANLNIVSPRPLRGNALFVFDPALVFTVVDNMFGGDSRFQTHVEGRDFTPTEQRIVQRMLTVVLENYQSAWAPVHALKFEFQRSEMHPQFASIATPSEVVVCTTFNIEIGSAGGEIHICFPYSTLEPLRAQLYGSAQTDTIGADHRWMRMLTRQVQLADVELVAKLARTEVTLQQILSMKTGDVIGLDLQPTLTTEIDGVPVFECRYGVLNGQYSIKIEKMLTVAPQDNSLGDEHVH